MVTSHTFWEDREFLGEKNKVEVAVGAAAYITMHIVKWLLKWCLIFFVGSKRGRMPQTYTATCLVWILSKWQIVLSLSFRRGLGFFVLWPS